MISTRDLSSLPDLTEFRRLTQSLAVLDAILSPERAYRYYAFDAAWAKGQMMASMRNGSGDHWFALICDAGSAIVGLDHESSYFEPGHPHPSLFAGLPSAFRSDFLEEPAFDTSNATFCIWRCAEDEAWRTSVDVAGELAANDGSAEMLTILEGEPRQYVEFAGDYYERQVELADVAAVYEHRVVDRDFVARLNPEADFGEVERELRDLGYPEGG